MNAISHSWNAPCLWPAPTYVSSTSSKPSRDKAALPHSQLPTLNYINCMARYMWQRCACAEKFHSIHTHSSWPIKERRAYITSELLSRSLHSLPFSLSLSLFLTDYSCITPTGWSILWNPEGKESPTAPQGRRGNTECTNEGREYDP